MMGRNRKEIDKKRYRMGEGIRGGRGRGVIRGG